MRTDYDRAMAALAEAQERPCGWIHGPCAKPRAKGDHLCAQHRHETDVKLDLEHIDDAAAYGSEET